MKSQKIVYSVCFYAERDRTHSLVNHYESLLHLTDRKNINAIFLVVCCFNDMHNKERIDDKLNEIKKLFISNERVQIETLPIFNWGGTIAALWHCWKDFLLIDRQVDYVAHFEEDFFPVSLEWYEKCVELIGEKDFVYIGETTSSEDGHIKSTFNCKERDGLVDAHGRHAKIVHIEKEKISPSEQSTRVKIRKEEFWTDGGFYFTKPDKLKIIEDKIGIFHKGNQDTLWSHEIDGIDYGEVGFPTLLHHSGLNFTSISRQQRFSHSNIKIEKMTEEHLEFFLAVRNEARFFLDDDREFSIEQCKSWFQESKPQFFIIKFNDNLVGYIRLSNINETEKSVWVGMDIEKSHRGKSISKLAYTLLFNHLRSLGYEKVYLNVLEFNNVAKNLYIKLGFKETGIEQQLRIDSSGKASKKINMFLEL